MKSLLRILGLTYILRAQGGGGGGRIICLKIWYQVIVVGYESAPIFIMHSGRHRTYNTYNVEIWNAMTALRTMSLIRVVFVIYYVVE